MIEPNPADAAMAPSILPDPNVIEWLEAIVQAHNERASAPAQKAQAAW